jgi:thiamine-phosphate pyrophosphorylase
MPDTARNAPELILVIEPTAAGLALLARTIADFPPACLIVTPPGGLPFCADGETDPPVSPPLEEAAVRPLVEAAQAAGIAILIADDPATAKAVGADGVHLTATEDLAARQDAARRTLGPDATIGVLSDMTRHTAMLAGEAGADYIAFDIRANAPDGGVDLTAWWAEIFEVPVAALVGFDPDRARAAAAAGADFLALAPPTGGGSPDTSALFDKVRVIMSGSCEA